MTLIPTRLPGVLLMEMTPCADARGWFAELYNERQLHAAFRALDTPAPTSFVQDNISLSACGVVRGLHYQCAPQEQGKLVTVLTGAIFEVAVDIRHDSPTLGQWVGVTHAAADQRSLWIPPGFAHGFMALEDDTRVFYKVTRHYSHVAERSLRWDDPDLAIAWPDVVPVLSDRDQRAMSFAQAKLSQMLL